MNCNLEFKIKKELSSKGIIDNFETNLLDNTNIKSSNKILDLKQFEEYNNYLARIADEFYNVGEGKAYPFKINKKESDNGFEYTYTENSEIIEAIESSIDAFNNYIDTNYNSILDLEFSKQETLNFEISSINKTKTPAEVIFNEQLDNMSSSEVFTKLNNLIDKNEVSEILLEKLDLISKDIKPKFKFENILDNALMAYDAQTNTILVNRSEINEASSQEIIHNLLHEFTHAATVKSLNNPITVNEKMFSSLMEDLFNEYKNTELNNDYAFTSIEEFVAELYSNQEFFENIEKQEKSLLDKFVDYIRGLFGLKPKNNKIIKSILKVAEENSSNPTEISKVFYLKKEQKNDQYQEFKNETVQSLQDNLKKQIKTTFHNINANFRRVKKISDSISDGGKKQTNFTKYVDSLEKFKNNLEKYIESNNLEGALTFSNRVLGAMDYIEQKINNTDKTYDELKNLYQVYNNYLKSYSTIEGLKETIDQFRNHKDNGLISEKDFEELSNSINSAESRYKTIKSRMKGIKNDILRYDLNDIKYFPELEKKHISRLRREHNQNNVKEDFNKWSSKILLGRDKDLLNKDLKEEVNKFLNNPLFDVLGTDVFLTSAINVSNKLVNIVHQKLNELDNERLDIEKEKDAEYFKLFQKLVAEKGTNNINKLYENLIKVSSDGNAYLDNGYSKEFYDKYGKYQNLIAQRFDLIKNNEIEESEKYKTKITKIKSELFESNNTIKKKFKIKNNLSKVEQEVLDVFIQDLKNGHKGLYGYHDSLINYHGNKSVSKENKDLVFELPKATMSMLERIWSGRLKGVGKEQFTDLSQVKADDVGFISERVDGEGNTLNEPRLHYRGYINKNEQSLDLFTLMRLEFKNTNAYQIRRVNEPILGMLLDLSKDKEYYEKKGTFRVRNALHDTEKTILGEKANTPKMVNNIVESRFYDILNKPGQKIASWDANKLVNNLNGLNSLFSLTFNAAQGVANIVNTNTQLFFESFLKGHFIKSKSIMKAQMLYTKDLPNILKDNINPVERSFVNKLHEMFNTKGLLNYSESNFLASDLIKKGFSRAALASFQSSGEHWIQSVILMSVLDGQKAMNINHDYIDKKGKVVSKEKAASVLDMFELDSNGVLQANEHLVYNEHSTLTKWKEGGQEQMLALVEKKLFDTVGNYTKTKQKEAYRGWVGKLFGMYRKYLPEAMVSRFRSIDTVHKDYKDLRADELKFSYGLKEYEEGTYTTLLRYSLGNLKQMYKYFKGIPTDPDSTNSWNQLSEYQKHNLKRAVVEQVTVWALLPLIAAFFAADDDEDKMFYAYQTRRLQSEIHQFTSLPEFYKIAKSPIPAAGIVQKGYDILKQSFNPTETYESGIRSGKNKLDYKVKSSIPGIREWERNYQDLFTYQNRNTF